MPNKIPSEEIEKEIEILTGWKKIDGRDAIHKTFKFKDFDEAWWFMSDMAQYAKEVNHHPEWQNIYDIVDVTLSTHDIGGLSDLDIRMAYKMNSIVGQKE